MRAAVSWGRIFPRGVRVFPAFAVGGKAALEVNERSKVKRARPYSHC